MSETVSTPGSQGFSFKELEPHRKKSKVSDLLCQVIGTQEVLTSKTTNYFTKLPHEVIICIFKYLDFESISKCALCCKNFWIASQDGVLYKNVCLKYSFHPKHIESYVSKISNPKKLKIIYKQYEEFSSRYNSTDFDNQIIKLLKKCGDRIDSLYIDSCRSEEVHLQLSTCVNLRKLNMIKCNSSFKTLPVLHDLISLKICLCDITTLVIGELLKKSRKLKVLSLTDVRNLEINKVAKIIGDCNPELEKLYICERRLIRSLVIGNIAKCPILRTLELRASSFCGNPEDSLQQLAAGCTKLEKLKMYGWKNVTDEHLEPILHTCTQLKDLDLRGLKITIKSCREAALSLPLLKTLCVYKCRRITDAQLAKLSKEFPEIDITNKVK